VTPQEAEEIVTRVTNKLTLVAELRLKDLASRATITSGFSREILRLSDKDVEFLHAVGIKVE
jgi:hypothetical protein